MERDHDARDDRVDALRVMAAGGPRCLLGQAIDWSGLSSTDAHLSAPKSRRRAELFSDCQGGRSTCWTSVCPHGCPETPAATVFPRFSRIGGLRSVHQSSLEPPDKTRYTSPKRQRGEW